MAETFELYVKNTSNCEGLPLQVFARLGPKWSGESLALVFGDGDERRRLTLVGWTDIYNGSPCEVNAVHVRWLPRRQPEISGGPATPQEGFLVYGGNSGVRALDPDGDRKPGTGHLPPGWGYPIVWVALDDVADFPQEVQDVITRAICQRCGEPLPLGASPYYVDEGRAVDLCDTCANPGDDAGSAKPRKYPAPTVDRPSIDQLTEWEAEGGCEATDGCWVESDGRCEHGHPSWLRYLGMI